MKDQTLVQSIVALISIGRSTLENTISYETSNRSPKSFKTLQYYRPRDDNLRSYISNGYGQIRAIDLFRRNRAMLSQNYGTPMEFQLPTSQLSNAVGHNIGRLFAILLFILVGSALIPSVANATTGITVAHTGFTPNVNITSTAGLVPLIQVLPLIFVGIILGFAVDELASVL